MLRQKMEESRRISNKFIESVKKEVKELTKDQEEQLRVRYEAWVREWS